MDVKNFCEKISKKFVVLKKVVSLQSVFWGRKSWEEKDGKSSKQEMKQKESLRTNTLSRDRRTECEPNQ